MITCSLALLLLCPEAVRLRQRHYTFVGLLQLFAPSPIKYHLKSSDRMLYRTPTTINRYILCGTSRYLSRAAGRQYINWSVWIFMLFCYVVVCATTSHGLLTVAKIKREFSIRISYSADHRRLLVVRHALARYRKSTRLTLPLSTVSCSRHAVSCAVVTLLN